MGYNKKVENVAADSGHEHGSDDPLARGTFEDRFINRDDALVDINDASLDPDAGDVYGPNLLPIYDLDQVIGQIATGYTIDAPNGVITYTFADTPQLVGLYNNPNFGFSAGDGYGSFNADQEAAARLAIEMWDDLIPQTFRETNGMGADIVFSNSADPAQAYAYYPEYNFTNAQGWKFFSDVFVSDPDLNWTNAWFTPSGYGNTTLIHELGHTLGLSHPGNYNGASASYADADYAQDSEQYSIMSYWSASNTGADIQNWYEFFASGHNPQTPLVHDILAIQSQYGADMTTRSGDTTYGFNTTEDVTLWVHDFAQNPYPYMTIYDAGGIDTIDMSGWDSFGNFLNLEPGSFSSIGDGFADAAMIAANRAVVSELVGFNIGSPDQATINVVMASYMVANSETLLEDTGVAGVYASNYDNFSIAYNTIIENAVGSQGTDVIWGNDADNILDGYLGDDVLDGKDGDDIIIGGLGFDEMTGGEGADTFVLDNLDFADIIMDFDGAEGDMLDLSGIADMLGTDLTLIEGDFSGAAGEVRYDGTFLEVSAGGDNLADYTVIMANNADVDASMMALAMSA